MDETPVEMPPTPPDLIELVNLAIQYEEVQGCGGRFDYPGNLDCEHWLAMRALYRARKKHEADEARRRDEKSGRGNSLEQQHDEFLKRTSRIN